jgi:hypothetical protein
MPWAIWAVATLLAIVWVPLVGEWVARAIILLTLLPISIVTGLLQGQSDSIQGAIGVVKVAPAHTAIEVLEGYWREFGFPISVWLAILVALSGWIVWRKRTQHRARGAVNALVLVAGWPFCFWDAMYIFTH